MNAVKEDEKTTDRRSGSSKSESRVVFKARDSLFDELFYKNEMVRGFVFAVLVCLFYYIVSIIVHDSVKAGRLYWDVSGYTDGWGSLRDIFTGILLELSIILAGFLIYPIFMCWVAWRKLSILVDVSFALIYSVIIISSFPVLIWVKVYFKLPSFIGIVLVVEQLRFCMKSYSFVRENGYKVLYPWNKDDKSGPAVWYDGQMSPRVGSFSHYVYFLFCPTLLYRDHYPRNAGPINWFKVLFYFVQVLIPLMVCIPLYKRFLTPESMKWSDLLHCWAIGLPTGLLSATAALTCLMHGWMNFGAELTRFADREFYTDWWNSTIYTEFYRKWNIIPHHFIHEYLYKDVRKIIHFRPVLLFVPLLTSSLIHEYIIAIGTGHIFPLTTILFSGTGLLFVYLWPPKRFKALRQLIILGSLGFGLNLMMVGTIFESKARLLCPRDEETWLDLFIPRILECFKKYNS